ncbi:MAG: hypothetical protein A2096_09455 [Spirochaetes bacterium GWF1_41_5]|nr:MAG: hypothetical protein A2096_09455 [Spirochaetes bacterium GWF1_41_5]HBE03663.1 hypothetical protein [Spirochaetia bacterium]
MKITAGREWKPVVLHDLIIRPGSALDLGGNGSPWMNILILFRCKGLINADNRTSAADRIFQSSTGQILLDNFCHICIVLLLVR